MKKIIFSLLLLTLTACAEPAAIAQVRVVTATPRPTHVPTSTPRPTPTPTPYNPNVCIGVANIRALPGLQVAVQAGPGATANVVAVVDESWGWMVADAQVGRFWRVCNFGWLDGDRLQVIVLPTPAAPPQQKQSGPEARFLFTVPTSRLQLPSSAESPRFLGSTNGAPTSAQGQ